MTTAAPPFEEWLDYCFGQGPLDAAEGFPEEPRAKETQLNRVARFTQFPKEEISAYVLRLLTGAGELRGRYRDGQLAAGVRFVFGKESGFLWDAFDELSVSVDQHTNVVRALPTIYRDLFDRVCNNGGSHPDDDLADAAPVDRVVVSLWELGCLEVPLLAPERYPELMVPCLEVLEEILTRCRTASCKASVLKALGHAQMFHAAEVDAILGRFFKRRSEPAHVVKLARAAHVGYVQ